MRRLLVAGNWKMNGSHDMTVEIVSGVLEQAANMSGAPTLAYDLLVCPPSP